MVITTKNKLSYLQDTKTAIKNALIEKGQTVADTDTFRSYAAKINSIEVSAAPVLESLEVTENGNYTPSAGTDGFSSVSVQVPDIPAVVQPLEVTENGTYTAPAGVDGYSPVTVAVPEPEINLQDKTITENGTYTADSGYDGLGSVTVEVAGSGGGSLPAGGYWAPFEDISRPNDYNWNWFEYGGDLYAFTSKVTESKGAKYRYKLVNGVWEKLADETWIDADVYYMRPVEYGGKLHFTPANGTSSYHWTFDGTTAVKLNNLPGSVNPHDLFVQDERLKCYYANKVYVWDETTDTWTSEKTLSFLNSSIGLFVDNGTVYMCADNKMYIYANKNVTQYYEGFSYTIYSDESNVVLNGKLYYTRGDSRIGISLFCFDFAKKTNTYITKVQTQLEYGVVYLKAYLNKLLVLSGVANYSTILQLYEVTE